MTATFTEIAHMTWIFYFSVTIAVGLTYSQAQARLFKLSEAKNANADCASGNCGEAGTSPASQVNKKDLRDVANKVRSQAEKNFAITEKQLDEYSNSDEVQATIAYAIVKKHHRSKGKCYKFVKAALAARTTKPKGPGLVSAQNDDLFALNAKETLKLPEFGFKNLLEMPPYDKLLKNNPSAAPVGAVLVYSSRIPCKGKPKIPDCGHVEIKTGKPGKDAYVSDFGLEVPISETSGNQSSRRRFYRLVGIMVKLGVK